LLVCCLGLGGVFFFFFFLFFFLCVFFFFWGFCETRSFCPIPEGLGPVGPSCDVSRSYGGRPTTLVCFPSNLERKDPYRRCWPCMTFTFLLRPLRIPDSEFVCLSSAVVIPSPAVVGSPSRQSSFSPFSPSDFPPRLLIYLGSANLLLVQ